MILDYFITHFIKDIRHSYVLSMSIFEKLIAKIQKSNLPIKQAHVINPIDDVQII
jgi:hypothetical protein